MAVKYGIFQYNLHLQFGCKLCICNLNENKFYGMGPR